MKILSISDVITNSSSEVFILKSNCNSKELKNKVEHIHNDGYKDLHDSCSGMGGILDIGDWTVFYISQAALLWKLKNGDYDDYEFMPIPDYIAELYDKYPNIINNEFSYTVEDWAKEFNLTDDDVSALLYLDSDHSHKAVRKYICDNCTILGGDYYEQTEQLLPYPGEAYYIFCDNSLSYLRNNRDFAKYVINQINCSKFKTFMDYSKYL